MRKILLFPLARRRWLCFNPSSNLELCERGRTAPTHLLEESFNPSSNLELCERSFNIAWFVKDYNVSIHLLTWNYAKAQVKKVSIIRTVSFNPSSNLELCERPNLTFNIVPVKYVSIHLLTWNYAKVAFKRTCVSAI